MVKPDAPCRGCLPPDRNAACHINCTKYLDYLIEKEKYDKWFALNVVPKLAAREHAIIRSMEIKKYKHMKGW